MIALKIVKWKNRLKKMDFADLVKDAKSVTSFSPCLRGLNDIAYSQPGCKDSLKMAASEVDLSRRISSG